MFISHNKEEMKQGDISKHSSQHPNQVILFMITDREKWHYLAVKSLSKLLIEFW